MKGGADSVSYQSSATYTLYRALTINKLKCATGMGDNGWIMVTWLQQFSNIRVVSGQNMNHIKNKFFT